MFLLILLISFYFGCNSTLGIKAADNFGKTDNTIIFSLGDYNVYNPDGESIETLCTLLPNSVSEIIVTNIPVDVHFVVVQAHSYLKNVTLSYDEIPSLNSSITGTNVGLIKLNERKNVVFYLMSNNATENFDVMIAIQAYGSEAPVPGGCNMEFQVEVSPFLQTTYNDAIITVDFQPASPPLSVFPYSPISLNSICNIKPPPVHHQMYYHYFPERDFSKETYFNILKSMMTKGRITKNGIVAREKLTSSPVRRIFASYPGTGVAFVVVSQFKNNASVYVPSFTYSCSDLKENNTCSVLTTTFSKLLCASILFTGLFACFVGHSFFRTEIFLFGFLVSGIVTYILVSLLFSNSIALSAAVAVGFFAASSTIIAWTIFGVPIISVTLATLTFGFLLASTVFYPLTDYVDLLVLDINYWGIFIGIVSACPLLMLCMAEKANIAACSFLGSYVAIISIDHYIGSNLRFIAINTIRRAVVEKFSLAIIGPPFQIRDLLLCLLWAVLLTSGIALQNFLMRSKPPYPPPTNPLKTLFRRLKGPSTASRKPSEVSPLLRHEDTSRVYF